MSKLSSFRPGMVETRRYYFEEAGKDMDYAMYVPTGCTETEKLPLVVLLHGLGSNPMDVMGYKGIVDEAENRDYVVVAPWGYNEGGFYGCLGKKTPIPIPGIPDNLGELSEKDVVNVVATVRRDLNIDEKRIYLMGHSMGGVGTLYLGAVYRDTWAALVPMSPAVIRFDGEPLMDWPRVLQPMKQIPTLVITGTADELCPVKEIRKLVNTMRDQSMPITYRELHGCDHLEPARRPDVISEVFDFFDRQRRAQPAPNVLVPTAGTSEGLQNSALPNLEKLFPGFDASDPKHQEFRRQVKQEISRVTKEQASGPKLESLLSGYPQGVSGSNVDPNAGDSQGASRLKGKFNYQEFKREQQQKKKDVASTNVLAPALGEQPPPSAPQIDLLPAGAATDTSRPTGKLSYQEMKRQRELEIARRTKGGV